MAEISMERSGEMVRATIEVLQLHPDGLPGRDVIPLVEQRLQLTDDELSYYPNKPAVRKFDNRVRFATISPVKAGWLVKANGIWLVTPEGVEAIEAFPEPGSLMREARRLYKVWKKSQPDAVLDEIDEDEVVTAASTTLEEAQESARIGIHEFLASMPPYEFQELVAGLLRAMGYHVPWVAPPGRDGGVDIVAFTDPIGATGPRIKVQVKRQSSSKIGVDGLRSFLAVLGQQDTGVFVSLAGFTADAEAEARSQENRRLLLIDEERLIHMWVEHFAKLAERDKARFPLEPVYFLSRAD